MDKNLSLVFWLIAVIGLVGFAFSLSASLWANVDRKRKELSVLRLVGFRTGDIVWFPNAPVDLHRAARPAQREC